MVYDNNNNNKNKFRDSDNTTPPTSSESNGNNTLVPSSPPSSQSIELDDFNIDLEEGDNEHELSDELDEFDYSGLNENKSAGLRQRLIYFIIRLFNGPKTLRKDVHFNKFNDISFLKLDKIEKYPIYFHDRYSKKIRFISLILYLIVWSLMIYNALHDTLTKEPSYKHLDEDEVSVISLSCRQSSLFWQGKNSKCGLYGDNCKPFEDREIIFRCPALCDMDSITYSEIPVGDQIIKYKSFYIGGGTTKNDEKPEFIDLKNGERVKVLSKPYRSDSFPCGAAVHAGVISPLNGGCARVKFSGEQPFFKSSKSSGLLSNSMDSIEFNSFFPSSFRFVEFNSKNEKCSNCYDMRFKLFLINYTMGLIIFYLDINSLISFIILSIIGFWSIILSFDPPIIIDVLNKDSLPSLISLGFERFLPCIFIIYTFWNYIISYSLKFPNSSICKILFWYNCYWLGILNNITFDRLPVDRLTLKDIKTQPGSLLATLLIILFILICSIIQGFKLWESGKFKKNLVIYSSLLIILSILGNLPHLNLRIHHYILAMILIIGTKTKGLTAMIFQGLLYGLLINGIARWGFASILETRTSLLRGDPRGDIKPPQFIGLNDNNSLELSWQNSTDQLNYLNGDIITPMNELKGYSLLINDIEMYNGLDSSVNLMELMETNEELNYLKKFIHSSNLETNDFDKEELDIYLRVGRSEANDVKGHGKRSDYTKAGVLKINKQTGEFKFIKPGNGLT